MKQASKYYLLLGLISCLIAWGMFTNFSTDIEIPYGYDGDSLFYLWVIKRVVEGSYFFNTYTGYPFGSDFFDFPGSDAGSLFIFWLLSPLKNPGTIFNLYFYISLILSTWSFFYVCKKMKIDDTLCFTGALIYSLVAFHFLRIPHLFYLMYFVVPFYFWFCWLLYTEKRPIWVSNKSRIKNSLLLIILSSFGVYYAFFASLILVISGVMGAYYHRSLKNLYSAILCVFMLSAGVLINVGPNIIYNVKNGTNSEMARRSPVESEVYGLKLTQLILPNYQYRIRPIAGKITAYFSSFPLNNENMTSSLGLFGSLGFLVGLWGFILNPSFVSKNKTLYLFAAMNLCMLLFATIGGFSTLFSVLITPLIRGWNRISIFISFSSITILLIAFEQVTNKMNKNNKILLCSLVVIICSFDQIPRFCKECFKTNKQTYNIDKSFTEEIEKLVPNGSIYQIPYMPFHGNPPIHMLGDYMLFKGYLHSNNLKWSYGGTKGRNGDQFYKKLSEQPIQKQFEEIKKMSFSGIYVDRRGFVDNGKQIEEELQQITRSSPIISADNTRSFFVIDNTSW